jgi:cytochrome c-type biogenesis protein CcmH/NrfG
VTVDGLRQHDESGRDERGRDETGRGERWYLEDEREFLCRSLDDAEREHEAGDLSDDDHTLLVARDSARLAEVEAELALLGEEPAGPPPETKAVEDARTERARLPHWRLVGIVASCLLIAAGAVILVVHFVSARQPGQASSGSITVSQAQQIEQQLAQAQSFDAAGGAANERKALALYDEVLDQDPSNPAALSGAGWILWNLGTDSHVSGFVEDGRAEVIRAVKVSPTYYQAHLYLGLILANQDHNYSAAVVQFDEFLADDPPSNELPVVSPEVDPSYVALGKPVPAALAVPASTTTKPSAP